MRVLTFKKFDDDIIIINQKGEDQCQTFHTNLVLKSVTFSSHLTTLIKSNIKYSVFQQLFPRRDLKSGPKRTKPESYPLHQRVILPCEGHPMLMPGPLQY